MTEFVLFPKLNRRLLCNIACFCFLLPVLSFVFCVFTVHHPRVSQLEADSQAIPFLTLVSEDPPPRFLLTLEGNRHSGRAWMVHSQAGGPAVRGIQICARVVYVYVCVVIAHMSVHCVMGQWHRYSGFGLRSSRIPNQIRVMSRGNQSSLPEHPCTVSQARSLNSLAQSSLLDPQRQFGNLLLLLHVPISSLSPDP